MGKFFRKFKFERLHCSQPVWQTRCLAARTSQLERTFYTLLCRKSRTFRGFKQKKTEQIEKLNKQMTTEIIFPASGETLFINPNF